MRLSSLSFCAVIISIDSLFAALQPTSTNTYGAANKMCCTSTITSRQIHSGLGTKGSGLNIGLVASLLPQESSEWPPSTLMAQDNTLQTNADDSQNEKAGEFPQDSLFAPNAPLLEKDNYAIWANTFSEWSSQAPLGAQPAFHYHIYGGAFGFNFLGFKSCAIGAGLIYDRINLFLNQNLGKQQINYALGTFYASFPIKRFSINLAATGGFLYTKSIRNVKEPTFTGTATSKYPGYQVMPHMDMNYDFSAGKICTISPFFQIDWALNIESAFKEYGAGIFDLQESSVMASLLREEVGINFFEKWDLKEKGLLIFRQKGSYVHVNVFQHGNPTIELVSVAGSFPLLLGNGFQNFGSWAAEVRYQSRSTNLILTFEGFYGDGFVNNAGYFTLSQGF
jgi:hypothetical protein